MRSSQQKTLGVTCNDVPVCTFVKERLSFRKPCGIARIPVTMRFPLEPSGFMVYSHHCCEKAIRWPEEYHQSALATGLRE
jgi:hypothetical protein